MCLGWGTACFQCRIEINIAPYLLFVIVIQIRGVIANSQIFRRLWYRQLFTVWDRLHCKRQIWIFHCVFGFEGDPCYVC